ncbi:MAG: pyridoxamine 5'-phosphate oxidase family protein [Gloeobacteraceae cyanobacterium ES-bin-316]|nr:pyridoxamine 5'-phosphate oxidase family protein [Ferruginibacter sp.]
MSQVENLSHQEALQKVRKLAADKVAMFTTFSSLYSTESRPMYTQGIDDDGTFWFFSKSSSNKNAQIANHASVHLMYSNSGSDAYLSVKGKGAIVEEESTIDRLWSDFAKVWFEEGRQDPSLTLIRVTPEQFHYWDPEHGR